MYIYILMHFSILYRFRAVPESPPAMTSSAVMMPPTPLSSLSPLAPNTVRHAPHYLASTEDSTKQCGCGAVVEQGSSSSSGKENVVDVVKAPQGLLAKVR